VRRIRRAVAGAAVLAAMGTLAACTDPPARHAAAPPPPTLTASGPAPSGPSPAATDWPTYHHDDERTGIAPGVPSPGTLATAWRRELDGAVYGQPLVLGDRVFAATENDSVYALDAATGSTVWAVHLGEPQPLSDLPCGNIDPLGITSTMAYDPATRLLFALAETRGGHHTLVGLDAVTGAVRLRRAAEPPRGDRVAHQQRAALTVLDGHVYVAYGGLWGDCGNYIGSVVAVPTTGDAPPRTYVVPTARMGGIWAPGGAAVRDGLLYYSVGNGNSRDRYDGSDSVLALRPDLTLADRFSPSVWARDNAADLDLGSMSPALVGDHVLIAGKRGVGYTLRADRLGGIGGEVDSTRVCRAFGGSAVDGDTVYLPCRGEGVRAVAVDSAGRITERWRAPVPADGSPVLGGGAVWVVDVDAGVLYALDAGSGRIRAQVEVGGSPHFASPTLAGQRAYVGTLAGVVAVRVR
jgi:polyvinyl alcohol dehydrogenase (cytochrome)